MEFIWVYIREAHPSDGAQAPQNIQDGIILPAPRTLEEREGYATQAVSYLGVPFTVVVDTMDDRVGGLYQGWPLRLYLVGADGRIAYSGGKGPRDYNPAELERAIAAHLGLDGFTNASAASYRQHVAAPDAIVAAFGSNWTTAPEDAASPVLPLVLGGLTVAITDHAGRDHQAGLYAVREAQVNYVVPPDVAEGPAIVTARLASGEERRAPLLIERSAPGLISANGSGAGPAAAHAVYVAADGVQNWELASAWDETRGDFASVPIRLGASPRVVLVLYGTGLRHAEDPRVLVGGQEQPLLYSGAQGQYPGLDQVNVLLPPQLAGRGSVPVVVVAGGEASNTVSISLGE